MAAARHFTLEEANAAVQVLRPLLAEILEIRQELLRRQPEVWPVVQKAAGNGGSQAASQAAAEFGRLDALVHEVLSSGAILKDINTGLVDFPAFRAGEEIYLCWQYGEAEVLFWHEIEAGFAGPKRL
jgi:hypothetical protein